MAERSSESERRAAERRRTPGRRLTDRQTAVLDLVSLGLENKEIGHQLGISEQAVKEHVSNLLRLLAAPNRAALADHAATLRILGSADVAPEWMSLLFMRAPMLAALHEGRDHRFVAVNDAYRAAAGPRELSGRTFREAFPDLDEGGILSYLDAAYTSGGAVSATDVPARWYRGEGGTLASGYLTVLVQPMRHADGTVGGVAQFAIDVTLEVEARAAAKRIADEQLAILEQLPSGVVTIDSAGVITTINTAGREILGVGDIVGTTAWDTLNFTDAGGTSRPADERPLRRALRGEHVRASDQRAVVIATGKIVTLRISASPLFDDARNVRGAVAVFTPLSSA